MARVLLAALIWWAQFVPAWASERALDRVVAAYYPPLMIDDSAKPGLAIEILQTAAARLNRGIALEFLPFRRALKTVQRQPDTLMPALFRNPERENAFQWISAIHTAKGRFLSLDQPINSLGQARRLGSIGVETASTGDALLSRLEFDNVERVSSPATNASKLNAGWIDAWLLTQALAASVWAELDFERELIAGEIMFETPIYLVAGPQFPKALAQQYRAAIKDMAADGTIQRILSQYE
ncbi:MAG: transporter substrate-binding domain-containing protein [Pseudomonadota bacterium]